MLIFLVCANTIAQTGVVIEGRWNRGHKGSVSLFTIEHGRLEEKSTCKIDTTGKFGFHLVTDKETLFVIGTNSASVLRDKYTFYGKPGDKVNFTVNDTSYTLTGKNTSENKLLKEWHDEIFPLEWMAIYFLRNMNSYKDFFPKLEEINNKLSTRKWASSGNKKFDRVFKEFREINMLGLALESINTPKLIYPSPADYTPYYRQIKLSDYTADTRLLRYPFGSKLLTQLQKFPQVLTGIKVTEDASTKLQDIRNDTLKGELLVHILSTLRTYDEYSRILPEINRYVLTSDQKSRALESVAKLAKTVTKPGYPALDFQYPDVDNNMISLSQFKGKVVLVDVWATWCAPCKAEIPALKKLEKEMHGKNVVFMSVSVDEERDRQKWKDFVKKEQLGGVQLFASGWSAITKLYDIKGIPRFMLFDQAGNIVSIDSPRPSNPKLKEIIEGLLSNTQAGN